MKAIILAHQQGLKVGDVVDVQPSVLNVKGIFVGDERKYLTSGYLLLEDEQVQLPAKEIEQTRKENPQ